MRDLLILPSCFVVLSLSCTLDGSHNTRFYYMPDVVEMQTRLASLRSKPDGKTAEGRYQEMRVEQVGDNKGVGTNTFTFNVTVTVVQIVAALNQWTTDAEEARKAIQGRNYEA